MIPIQVLGTGLIPRGYGLAPRKEPFKADRTLILTILKTPGLTVNFVNPETGAITELNNGNVNRIYDKWANYNPKKPAPQVVHTKPVAPVKPANPPKKAQVHSFPEKTDTNEVHTTVKNEHVAEEFTGLPMDSLIGGPLKPSARELFENLTDRVKGAKVQPGNLNGIPDQIDPSQVPEGMVLGLPADPNAPVDGEAVLITVVDGKSEETTLPEEPIDTTGYHTPDVGESESTDGEKESDERYWEIMAELHSESEDHKESDDKEEEADSEEETPKDINSFKPILSSDDRAKPNPNYRPNNHNHKKKNHR